MIKRYNGDPNIQMYKKKVSTTFSEGSLVVVDVNGFLDKAVAGTTAVLGVCMQTVLATDANYAVSDYIGVDVPRRGDQFVADVGTGTPAQTQVGETHDLDSDLLIDVVAVLTNVVKVEKILGDATKVIISFPNTAG
jgi:hypothetical protein